MAPRSSTEPYQAPAWLPGGHAQTLYPVLIGARTRAQFARKRWDTPDGDFIDVDFTAARPGAPLVVLFHGLEGGSRSHYAGAFARELSRRGWQLAVAHFRGCSGEPNLLPRAYHSGDWEEIRWILGRFRDQTRDGVLFAVGVSLGGNALLRWLGEDPHAQRIVNAAAAISAPVDLMAAGDALGCGFNLVYTRAFLRTMKGKGRQKLERYPGLFDRQAMLGSRTLRQFDNVVTAPLHGFRDTDDYWTRASSKPVLARISVPTLLLNARNDPFMPQSALPGAHELAPAVRAEFPDEGGHVGFVTSPFPGRLHWLPGRVADFLQSGSAGLV